MACAVSSDVKLAKRFTAAAPNFSVLSTFCVFQKPAPILLSFLFFNSELFNMRGLLVPLDGLQSYPMGTTNAGTSAPEHMVLLVLQEEMAGTKLLNPL